MMNAQQIANEWRAEYGYTGAGGVVVVHAGTAQGWVNELRDPHHWEPGCIAVDENGRQWLAAGGNNYDGAEEWAEILPAGSTVLLRGDWDADTLQAMAARNPGALLICLQPGQSIESLGEEEMRRFGWVRMGAELDRLRSLARNLLDPEMFGFTVTAEVRDAARLALGKPAAEGPAREKQANGVVPGQQPDT